MREKRSHGSFSGQRSPSGFGDPQGAIAKNGREPGELPRPSMPDRKGVGASRPAPRLPRDEFAALCTQQERRLYTYVLALVANRTEAEEILQETLLVLWEKFDAFAPGTNFLAWAYATARLEVLKYRERQSRDRRLLSLEAIEVISAEVQAGGDLLDLRHAALRECLEKLSDRQRSILQQRYQAGTSIDALADRLGRSRDAVYQILSRIRRSLAECIDRSVASRSRQ